MRELWKRYHERRRYVLMPPRVRHIRLRIPNGASALLCYASLSAVKDALAAGASVEYEVVIALSGDTVTNCVHCEMTLHNATSGAL